MQQYDAADEDEATDEDGGRADLEAGRLVRVKLQDAAGTAAAGSGTAAATAASGGAPLGKKKKTEQDHSTERSTSQRRGSRVSHVTHKKKRGGGAEKNASLVWEATRGARGKPKTTRRLSALNVLLGSGSRRVRALGARLARQSTSGRSLASHVSRWRGEERRGGSLSCFVDGCCTFGFQYVSDFQISVLFFARFSFPISQA